MRIAIVYRVVPHWRAPILSALAHAGHEVLVIHGPSILGTKTVNAPLDPAAAFSRLELPSTVIKTPAALGGLRVPVSRKLTRALNAFSPDCLIVEGASNLVNAAVAMRWANRNKVAVVWWSLGRLARRPDGRIKLLRRTWDQLVSRVEKRATGVLTYSTLGRAHFLAGGWPADRITVAVNTVDTSAAILLAKELHRDTCRRELEIAPTSTTLLFVGALESQKRVDRLLEALKQVTGRGVIPRDLTVVIVGDGSQRKALMDTSEALGLNDIVRFDGRVVDGVGKYFVAADALIVPGLGGLVISEAMAYGLPVVCGPADGVERDLVIDRVTGFFVEEDSVTALADALETLIAPSTDLSLVGRAAAAHIAEHFTTHDYVSAIQMACQTATTKATT